MRPRCEPVISAAHTIVYADDADADRAFFRDVLGFEAVDAGDGCTGCVVDCGAASEVISMKQILLFAEPAALPTVNRPSPTVTVPMPSNHRVALLGAPLTISIFSTLSWKLPSVAEGSPETMRT